MGLFDFLKQKSAVPPEDDGPSPHYVFAHYALRQIALSEPLRFLAIAASPEAEQFIDAILHDVAEHCGRKTSFGADAVRIHPTRVHTFPCAVIELPEPGEMAEAYMVAVVVPIDPASDEPPDMDTVQARYFTLEKGFSMSNEPRTVLAEWDTSAHANYGDGPAPTVEAFVQAISEHVNQSGP